MQERSLTYLLHQEWNKYVFCPDIGNDGCIHGIESINIGRSAGAVIDMHLHESATPEFRAKAGFLGFELGGGARIGNEGILDVNMRYSFTGLLANLGVDFGGEKIGFYDGVVSYRMEGAGYKLKMFGWAGRSENEFDKVEPTEDRERYKDFFDIDYSNDILGAGIRLENVLSNKTTLSTGLAYSLLKSGYARTGQFGPQPIAFDLSGETHLLSSNAAISIRHSSRFNSTMGVDYINKTMKKNAYTFSPFREEFFLTAISK
jgi:hypothetical protein